MHPHAYAQLRAPGGTDWQTLQRRWLRVREAAAHLNVSVGALNRLRCTGGGPKFAKLGAVVVYDIGDLDLWATERKVRRTSEPTRAGP